MATLGNELKVNSLVCNYINGVQPSNLSGNTITLDTTYPPTSTSSTTVPSTSVVSQIYTNSIQPVKGYDIIVVLGQSNGHSQSGAGNVDLNLDSLDPDILMLGSTTEANGYSSNLCTHTQPMLNAGWNRASYKQENTSIDLNGRVIISSDPVHHSYWWNYTNAANLSNGTTATIVQGVGFVRTFAKFYKANYLGKGRKIIIVGCAFPASGFEGQYAGSTAGGLPFGNIYGTILQNWKADGSGNLRAIAIKRANCAMSYNPSTNPTPNVQGTDPANPNNRCVAFLWHQGEDDVNTTQTNYKNYMLALIDNLRSSIYGATNTPFISGGFAPTSGANGTNPDLVLSTMGTYSSFGRYYCNYASASNLTLIDGVHFTASSQRILGSRYFDAYVGALANAPATVAATVSGVSASLGTMSAGMYALVVSFTTANSPTAINIYVSTNNGVTFGSSIYNTLNPSPITIPSAVANSPVTNLVVKVTVYNTVNASSPSSAVSAPIVVPATVVPVVSAVTTTPSNTTVKFTGTITNVNASDTVSIVFNGNTTTGTYANFSGSTGITVTGFTANTAYATGAVIVYVTSTVTGTNSSNYSVTGFSTTNTPSLSVNSPVTVTFNSTTQVVFSGTVSAATNGDTITFYNSGTSLGTPVSGGTITSLSFANTYNLTAGSTYSAITCSYVSGGVTSSVFSVPSFTMPSAYPPAALTANSTTLSAQSYGNGAYVASCSSLNNAANDAWYAFDKATNDFWSSVGGSYPVTATNVDGACVSSTTTVANSVSYTGEWLQIQLPAPILLSYYTINVWGTDFCPTKWDVMGSTTGAAGSWNLLNTQTTTAAGVSGSAFYPGTSKNLAKFNVTGNSTKYAYYRLVVERCSSPTPGMAVIPELILYGNT
jgi:hypothetical protein